MSTPEPPGPQSGESTYPGAASGENPPSYPPAGQEQTTDYSGASGYSQTSDYPQTSAYPQSSGDQAGYSQADPAGYGNQSGYGNQPGYGNQSSHGAQSGYGDQAGSPGEQPSQQGNQQPGQQPEQPRELAAAAPGTDDRSRRRVTRGVAGGIVAVLMILSLVVGLLIGLFGGQYLPAVPGGDDQGSGNGSSADPDSAPPGGGLLTDASVSDIAEAVLPSTVFIQVQVDGEGFSGSGFVFNDEGHVVTNEHVIAPALADDSAEVIVVFSDGSESVAEVVGATSDYDLAVLAVDHQGLNPLPIGDSDELLVGQPVVAIGAPLGLEGTVTSGIVSAMNRPVRVGDEGSTFINAIQTDAAINLGNSGGPLVDETGAVIGVNTAIAARPGQTGSIGLGFAIPSSQVARTAQEVIDTGQATYPIIGATLDSMYAGEGVQVLTEGGEDAEPIVSGGPADEAGVEPGDVIVAINGSPVTTAEELIVRIRAHAPGETITLTIRDDDGDREVDVVLGEQASA